MSFHKDFTWWLEKSRILQYKTDLQVLAESQANIWHTYMFIELSSLLMVLHLAFLGWSSVRQQISNFYKKCPYTKRV